MQLEVKTDALFISERLREIDENYFIVYHSKNKKFEIHNRGQQGDTYCLSVPFNSLDFRVLELVQKTKIENIKTLIEKLDKENLKTENAAYRNAFENTNEFLKLKTNKIN